MSAEEGTTVSTTILHPRGESLVVLSANRKRTARAVQTLTGASYQAVINAIDTGTLDGLAERCDVHMWPLCDVVASVNSPEPAAPDAVAALLEALVPACSWGADHNWVVHGRLAGAAAPADGAYLWAVADDEIAAGSGGGDGALVRIVRSLDQERWQVSDRRFVPLKDANYAPLEPGAAVPLPADAVFGATDTRLSFSIPQWDELDVWMRGLGYPHDSRPTGLDPDERDPLKVARRIADMSAPQIAPAVFCWPLEHADRAEWFHARTFDLTCDHEWGEVAPQGTNPPHARLKCRRCRWAATRQPLD